MVARCITIIITLSFDAQCPRVVSSWHLTCGEGHPFQTECLTFDLDLPLTHCSNRHFSFAQVIGDASPDASKLMKREGVRSVPSFHYFVGGEKVDVVNGANAEAIEATITKHT